MATTFTEIENKNCFLMHTHEVISTKSERKPLMPQIVSARKFDFYSIFKHFENHSIKLFVSFSINGLKENVRSLNYCSFREETLRFNCQLTVNGEVFFFYF